jgi:hypothetical protein
MNIFFSPEKGMKMLLRMLRSNPYMTLTATGIVATV